MNKVIINLKIFNVFMKKKVICYNDKKESCDLSIIKNEKEPIKTHVIAQKRKDQREI